MAQIDKKQSGFSLVELSVSLVIIGILVAGITSGMHLMKAAKINSVISEITGYKTAIENFRLKYNGWPGDLPIAASIWGAYVASPLSGATNGDGNELIDSNDEPAQTWRHLALANMIAGEYVGVFSGARTIGVHVPGSAITKGNYFPDSSELYGRTGNHLVFNSFNGTVATTSILTPADANLIDSKIDNEDPDSGDIYYAKGFEHQGDATKCVTGDPSAPSVDPVLTDPTVSCMLSIWLDSN